MNRPWLLWLVFGLCLAVGLGAVAWVSVEALRLDDAERQARRQAALETDIRTALWRMDCALGPILFQESGRPYFEYRAFHPAEKAFGKMYNPFNRGEVNIPSTLLRSPSPYILIHFQIGPRGELTSPQVPTGNMRDLAEMGYLEGAEIEQAAARLADFGQHADRKTLLAALPEPPRGAPDGGAQQSVVLANPGQTTANNNNDLVQNDGQPNSPAQTPGNPSQVEQVKQREARRSMQEYQMRQEENVAGQRLSNSSKPIPSPSSAVHEGLLQPLWCGDMLLLARRVDVNGEEYIQGCWLDWPALQGWLTGRVRNLLPNARLEACLSPAGGGPASTSAASATPEAEERTARRLAALPVRLVPGDVPVTDLGASSPLRRSLFIAWGCGILAALAVAALLAGALSLSARRGAFVSAVSHELRTPLTTFRLYAELLAEGMVKDEGKQRQYLQTLRAEADRLGHLVENVLAYARLERVKHASRQEVLPWEQLLGRMEQRLSDRAAQAGLSLLVERPAPQGATPETISPPLAVRADPGAVEQILFNLVDNACKYASAHADKRLHLTAGSAAGRVEVRVRDHGPGFAKHETRRLFRPFSKSARQAAQSAPGVGLGLALSRRLARQMGGDLRLDASVQDGACFVLTLPQAKTV